MIESQCLIVNLEGILVNFFPILIKIKAILIYKSALGITVGTVILLRNRQFSLGCSTFERDAAQNQFSILRIKATDVFQCLTGVQVSGQTTIKAHNLSHCRLDRQRGTRINRKLQITLTAKICRYLSCTKRLIQLRI